MHRPHLIDYLPEGSFRAITDSIAFRSGRTYKFSFEQHGRIWRAYIVSQPSYGSRSSGLHPTHRKNDGRYYVCFDPEPTSYEDIHAVATSWASRTERYLDSGTPVEG